MCICVYVLVELECVYLASIINITLLSKGLLHCLFCTVSIIQTFATRKLGKLCGCKSINMINRYAQVSTFQKIEIITNWEKWVRPLIYCMCCLDFLCRYRFSTKVSKGQSSQLLDTWWPHCRVNIAPSLLW